MATAISSQPIDPIRGARFPIHVSEQLVRDDRSRKRQRISVQCNRRPSNSSSSRTTIKPTQPDNSYELALSSAEGGEYMYDGVQRPTSTVALFYDPSEKTFTLDKIDADFKFELRSTPGQIPASSFVDGIDNGGRDQEDLFGGNSGDDEDTTPDPNNPYDYRHYLNKGNRSPSPAPSHAASPIPQPSTFNSSPTLPAAQASRPSKATKPSISRPSRPKQRTQEKPRYLSPKPRQEELDADNEDSDPDELVIDMGDSPPTRIATTSSRPWRSALSVLNEGGRGSAPFSLRSAASSMSPSLRGGSPSDEDNDDEEKEFEQAGHNNNGGQSDAEAEADDDDVEEIEFGNNKNNTNAADPMVPEQVPAQQQQQQQQQLEEAVTPGNGWDDDDDDELEAELALALEEDQAKSDIEEAARVRSGDHTAGVVVAAAAVDGGGESSEESEEE